MLHGIPSCLLLVYWCLDFRRVICEKDNLTLLLVCSYSTYSWRTSSSSVWFYTATWLLVYLILAITFWNFVTFFIVPSTQNEISYQLDLPTFTGPTAFLMYFFYPVIAGPIFEEMIYRGLVMTALEKGKKWGLDVLGSAALFGILHISSHGWVLTDFFVYMGGGLIMAVFFRVTKSIYWPIGLHIVDNAIAQILPLLF